MRMKMSLKGWKGAIKDIDRYVNRKRFSISKLTEKYGEKIKKDAIKRAPVDLGDLKRKIRVSKHLYRYRFKVVVHSDAKYSKYVEYGTRPHWAPFDKIEAWAKRHGVSAFAVWWKIGTYGTEEHPFLMPAFQMYSHEYLKQIKSEMKKQ